MVRSPRSFAVLAFCMERVNRAREIRALSCAKMLGLAALQYSQDHKDHYPDAGRWEQELAPYLDSRNRDILHPAAPVGGTPCRFSLNPALSGKAMTQIAEPANI